MKFINRELIEKHFFLFALVLPVLVLLAHAWSHMPFIMDDSLISIRYADRFLQGKGLTWNDGIPVEGYSNLLWVLLTALLGYFGVDLVDSVRILGFTCHSLVLAANYTLWRHRLDKTTLFWLIPAQLIFALSLSIGIWTVGGLEGPLIAACLAWALVLVVRALENTEGSGGPLIEAASLCLAMMVITRPDGPVFSVGIALGLLLTRGINRSSILTCCRLAVFPLLFLAGQLLFRQHYYGDWVPNTYYAKVTPSILHILWGATYLFLGLLWLFPVIFMTAKSLRLEEVKEKFRLQRSLFLTVFLCWSAYLISIGGDLFVGFRHIIPLVVLVAMAFPLSRFAVMQNEKYTRNDFRRLKVLAVAFVALQLVGPEALRSRTHRWEGNTKVLGLTLKKGFAERRPLLAVDAAGALPYYTEFESIDMLGLNDHHIARNPPDDIGWAPVGHGLGDGHYVLGRKPDLVSFCLPGIFKKACLHGGKEMEETAEFKDKYVQVRFKGIEPYEWEGWSDNGEYEGLLWVRKDSPATGMRSDGQTVTIPAYLFRNDKPVITRLNNRNQFVTDIPQDASRVLKNIELPGPVRSVTVVPKADGVEVETKKTSDGNYHFYLNNRGSAPHTLQHVSVTLD